MEQLKNNNNSIYYMGCIYTQKYTNSVCKQWIARKVPSTFFFSLFFCRYRGIARHTPLCRGHAPGVVPLDVPPPPPSRFKWNAISKKQQSQDWQSILPNSKNPGHPHSAVRSFEIRKFLVPNSGSNFFT